VLALLGSWLAVRASGRTLSELSGEPTRSGPAASLSTP
jgi:hypothetical protein